MLKQRKPKITPYQYLVKRSARNKILITTVSIDVSKYSDDSIDNLKDYINAMIISENLDIVNISFKITDIQGNEVQR